MTNLLIGLLGAVLATNQPAAVSNLIVQQTGLAVAIPDPNDPVEKEYQKLLDDDNAAQAEADQWITDEKKFADQGKGLTGGTLRLRIRQRFDGVGKSYQRFLERHPGHTRARLAYGSFLNDTGHEDAAVLQWEKARELDPKNPAALNNLANYHGHNGPVEKAFEYYEKAIALATNEPVYLQNFATTVYLFRPAATNYFKINNQQVFDKALNLYRRALALDPGNFPLATDLAQTFYGIQPPRFEQAMTAWQAAEKIAHDDIEREGVYLHYARWRMNSGRLDEARRDLHLVTNAMFAPVKELLLKNLAGKEARAKDTNAPPVLNKKP
ncbi:MAG: hypothetical protein EXS33_06685 [Pedosphaera sp.]|nr:hypothetical protein [Pedosphaera sp.]